MMKKKSNRYSKSLFRQQEVFSIRKLSLGVASVLLGSFFVGGSVVQAEEISGGAESSLVVGAEEKPPVASTEIVPVSEGDSVVAPDVHQVENSVAPQAVPASATVTPQDRPAEEVGVDSENVASVPAETAPSTSSSSLAPESDSQPISLEKDGLDSALPQATPEIVQPVVEGGQVLPRSAEFVGGGEMVSSEGGISELGTIEGGRLVIPEGVTEIESNAFSGSSLREVVFPSTLTKIGSGAFSGTSLTTISLPAGVTTIESYAFSGTQLTDISLPAGLTHLGDYAFGNISSLTSINIPKDINSDRNYYASHSPFSGSSNLSQISFDEGITVIPDYLFKDLSGLGELTLPNTVTRIGYQAFSNAGLTEVVLPERLTRIEDSAFSGTGLREVIIPAGVTHIGYNAFDIDSLIKVTLPSSLESASSAFTGSPNLKEVVLTGNWTKIPSGLFTGTGIERLVIPEGVTEIESNAFSGSSLREVVFPSTLTKIGSGAFSGTSLTTISLPAGVTTIESYAFSGTQLTDISLPAGLTHLGNYAFGNISSLTSINIPKDINSDRNYYASHSPFSGSSNLSQISFDEGITVIPDYLFKDLSGLGELTLPNTVTRIGYQAFSNVGLTEVVLPERLTRIEDSAFSGTGLREVIIPAGVTHIGYNAFDIDSLIKVTLPSSLESASSAFAGSPNLKEVVLTGNWTKIPSGLFTGTGIERLVIPEGVTEIESNAFSGSSLREVVFPSTLTKIGSGAFSGTSLTTISLPAGVTTVESYAFSGTQLTDISLPAGLTHLGDYAFGNISSLTSINIPKDINSDRNYYASHSPFSGSSNLSQISFDEGITVIPDYLFKDLSGLTELSIPSTVTTIGNGVFSGTGLREVIIPAGVTHIGYNAFDIDSLIKVTLPSSLESASSAFTGSPNLKEVVLTGNWTKIPSGLFTGTGIDRLVIPEGVTEIESNAFSGSSLREVVFPSTLTKIGSGAFSGTSLTTISLPAGVTTIESYAFSGTQLTDISLPAGLTHLGDYAFGNISSLTSINIPKDINSDRNYYTYQSPFSGSSNLSQISFDEGITVIPDYLFKDLSGLGELTLPNTVTRIGYQAFSNAGLTEVVLPERLTRIEDSAFSGTGLTEVVIPAGVTHIGYNAFDIDSLIKVTLPSSLESASSAFAGSSNLKEVVLTGNWTKIPSGLFTGTGIERLVIPEGVTEIESNAFSGSSLREVVFPSTLTKIGSGAFSGTSLTSISLPASVTTIESYAFSGTQLTDVSLPAGLTHLGDYAFGNISSLTSINIPKDINSDRNYYTYQSPFSGSSNLSQISFDEGITVIPDYLFKDLSGLGELTLPNTVTRIGYQAFSNAGLTEVVLPERLTRIEDSAFSGTGLTEVVIPAGVTHIGYNAFDIDSLIKVTLPSSLESASSAFAGSSNLKEVVLTGNWTKIPSGLFTGTGIERLVIPEGVTEIESNAFSGSSLREVVFPSTLTKIGSGAFSGTSLTSISLPASVTTIESYAFSGTQLTDVSLPAGLTHLGDYAFGNISSLTSINIPKDINSNRNYYTYHSPFAGSSNLTQISFDEGITVIPDYLFQGLSSLVGMLIPEGVTAIGNSAFASTNIADITLPTSLERIGSSAFSNTKLSSVIVPDNVKTIGSDAFRNTPLELVVLPREMTDLGRNVFVGTKLSILEIPEGITSIDDSLYADNEQLKRVYLPKSLTSFSRQRDWLITEEKPEEKIEYYVYIDSYALEYMIENQVPFKLRDENVSSDESKLLDAGNSFYLATSSSSRREGYLGLDLKYSLKEGKASDDGTYKLRLNIPTTTSLYNGTVRLDGQDIPVTLENGYINLPVTEREGRLKLTLKANNNNLTNVQLFAQLAYEKDGRKTAETIGAVNVVVPVLQVTANAVTSRTYARITGIADPADSLVAYLDGVEVGSIKVKKDGTYQLDVPFTTLENNKEYLIRVEATSPDGQGITASTTVRYEEGLPELENFIMRHNGYEYNLKEHGDKAPIISFRPGEHFEFEVEYSNSEQIGEVFITSLREGVTKSVRLDYDEQLKLFKFRGTFDKDNPNYVPGKLNIHITPLTVPVENYLLNITKNDIDNILSEPYRNPKVTVMEKSENKFTVETLFNSSTGLGYHIDMIKEKGADIDIEFPTDALFGNYKNPDYKIEKILDNDSQSMTYRVRDSNGVKVLELVQQYINASADVWKGGKIFKESIEWFAKNSNSPAGRLISNKITKVITPIIDKTKYIQGKAYEEVMEKFLTSKIQADFKGFTNPSKTGMDKYIRSSKGEIIGSKPGAGTVAGQVVGIAGYSIEAFEWARDTINIESYRDKINNLDISYTDKKQRLEAVSIAQFMRASSFGFASAGFGIALIAPPPFNILAAATFFGLGLWSKSLSDEAMKNLENQLEIGTSVPITDMKFAIDPSGIITNADSNLPVRGATTTVYYRGENGEEVLWDAGEYSQLNPLSTTVNGEYAWDVPEGYWKVKVEKEGYESAESEWLPVPPPQTEVHFKLKPHAYTIAYNAGEGSMPTTGLVTTYKTDVAVALPQPTRKGYKFAGWFEDSSLTGVNYLDTLFLKPGDKTLFAKWERATKLLGTEAEDAFIHLQGDDVDKVARLVKAEQAVSTLAVDLPEGMQESDVQLLTIQLLDAEGQAVSLTEPARMEIGLETERPPVKVLTYNSQDGRFEEVVFDWDGDLKELQFDLQDTANYLIVYQPLSVIITRTRQEVRVLTTDQVLELEDSDLAQGHTREEASINGQVIVEITENLTDGLVIASSEREISRIEATPRKVYRGTKVVSVTPVITTRTRQEVRVLTTDQVLELEDSDLAQGHTREEASLNGRVLVEITETLTDGQVTASSERELSRIDAIPRKIYRGTKVVSVTPVITTRTRQEVRVLTTDQVLELEDSDLAQGHTREEASINGQVLVEITETLTDGQVTASSERELSRTEAVPRKVYRGTMVVQVPAVAPTGSNLPTVKLTRVERPIKSVDAIYLEDATLPVGESREEAGQDGLVVVEVAEFILDGQVIETQEFEVSRTAATPRKIYRGAKEERKAATVEQKQAEPSPLTENVSVRNQSLPKTGQTDSVTPAILGLSLFLAGTALIKSRKDEIV